MINIVIVEDFFNDRCTEFLGWVQVNTSIGWAKLNHVNVQICSQTGP